MNPHLYTFIISLLLLLLLIDLKKLHINIYGGIIAALYKVLHNVLAYDLNLWKHHKVNLYLPDSIFFSDSMNVFIIGIAFTMGILFLQYLPQNLSLQFLHAFLWTSFYVLLKYLCVKYNILTYMNFRLYMSSHILIFLLSLAWFKNNFLKSKFT